MRCVNNKLTVANKQDSERSAIPKANGTSVKFRKLRD